MLNEAGTCQKLVRPKLLTVGWDTDPRSIAEQRSFTDGHIIVSAFSLRPSAFLQPSVDQFQSLLYAA